MPEFSLKSKCRIALFDSQTSLWEFLEVEPPEPEDGEILVKILACTVCGSDLHTVKGLREVPCPIILGHEIVGEIVAFGPQANRLAIDGQLLSAGDRIVWSIVASCDECFFCHQQLPQKCEHAVKYGHVRFTSPRQLTGGFADFGLLVPGTRCIRISSQLPLELACPTGCALATAVAAVDAIRQPEWMRVLILGGGLVGAMCIARLHQLGCQQIVCVEPNRNRWGLAATCGAQHTIETATTEALKQFAANRGFDAVIECSGQNSAFELGFSAVRTGGHLVLVGAVFPSSPVPLVLERIVRRNISLIGIHNYSPQQLVQALALAEWLAPRIPPAAIVAQWYPLEHISDAFQTAFSGLHPRVGIRMGN